MISEEEIKKVNVVLISITTLLWSLAMLLSYRWIDKTEKKLEQLDERLRGIEISHARSSTK